MPASTSLKKRLLIFSVDYFPYVGGAEVAVREVVRRMPTYECVLITCRNSRVLPVTEYDGMVRIVRVGWGIRHIDKYIFSIPAFFAARRLHAESPFCGIWGMMANTAGIAAAFFKIFHPRLFYVLSVQEGDSDAEYRRRIRFWRPLYRLVHAKADTVVAISEFLKKRTELLGYRGPVAIIPNGVDHSLFYPARFQSAFTAHTIITVSRLAVKNGIDDLIRAFALVRMRYGEATLVIVGDGAEKRRYKALANFLGVGAFVSFVGATAHDSIPHYLRNAGVFVRPSLSEGFGNAFIEAMACGIPVVGTRVGAIPEIIIHGKNGLLCEPHNPSSCCDAICVLFSDGVLRSAFVREGVRTAARYSWDAVASAFATRLDSFV